MTASDIRIDRRFALGDYLLDDGTTLPAAHIEYAQYGDLNQARDNVILAPTWFAGTPDVFEWLIGPGEPLDTDRYCVVAPSLFGNGLSSSPSNTPAPFDRGRFPKHTIPDNVRGQRRLLTEGLGATSLQLVFGGSMGTLQGFEWALRYPDMVQRLFACCGASRTSRHCRVFLSGAEAALRADQSLQGGDYTEPPVAGLSAVGRVWAGWSPSARFYRDGEYEKLGFESPERFVDEFWAPWFASLDANNLLSQLDTWMTADISANADYNRDIRAALADVRAKTYVVPSERDPYFPAEDAQWEVAQMPNAELHVIPGTWGHFALFGSDPASADFIRSAIRSLLDT